MKRVLALLTLLLALAACGSAPEPTFVPVEQQNVLTRMTRAAGYEVAGIPYYKDGRWISNVRIAGCKANITVAAQEAAEAVYPTSFTVLSVGNKPLVEFSPRTNGLLFTAEELKALPGAAEPLDCTA